jgi:hypothetical protein
MYGSDQTRVKKTLAGSDPGKEKRTHGSDQIQGNVILGLGLGEKRILELYLGPIIF